MQRRLFLSLLFGLFCLPVLAGPVEVDSYEDAVALAKADGSQVLVVFGGEDCPWCVKQKVVLDDPEVLGSLSGYILVRVDVSERKDLASRHKIKSIPVSMVVDSGEVVKKRNVGYMDKVKFLNWLR